MEGQPLTESRMRAARLLQQHGVRVKGHPLCWHTACADWLMQYDNKTILQKQLDRIQREVSNFKGVVDMWDVINEVVIMPVYRSDNAVSRICRYLGPVELVRQIFAAAKQENPQATLLINDFNLSDKYRNLIAACLDAGVPISSIGLQTHQHQGYMGRERLEELNKLFDKWKDETARQKIVLTIVPSTPEGEERQRREWREMYEILFSHPKVEAITGWDFADGAWLNAPSGLLRADNSPKPSYRELQRLIHEEWTSQGELHTDENGVAELAGFRETYSLHTDRAQAEVQLTAQPITQPRRILLQDCHT